MPYRNKMWIDSRGQIVIQKDVRKKAKKFNICGTFVPARSQAVIEV